MFASFGGNIVGDCRFACGMDLGNVQKPLS